jgi:hypothetical protein
VSPQRYASGDAARQRQTLPGLPARQPSATNKNQPERE